MKKFEGGGARREIQVKPHSLEIHIEELVLCGFPPMDRYRLGEAIEHELRRLLLEQGIPASLTRKGEMTQIDGGIFRIFPGSRSEVIGSQIARAIYGGSS